MSVTVRITKSFATAAKPLIDESEEETVVNLITIYDKADTATITAKELKELIKAFFL